MQAARLANQSRVAWQHRPSDGGVAPHCIDKIWKSNGHRATASSLLEEEKRSQHQQDEELTNGRKNLILLVK